MAKSQRSSVTKANNQRLKKNVFGPVEAARQQRLSARLLEIASQPKPVPEKEMKDTTEQAESEETNAAGETKPEDTAMEIDQTSKSTKSKKSKIVKRRSRKSNIVFPKFGDRNKKKSHEVSAKPSQIAWLSKRANNTTEEREIYRAPPEGRDSEPWHMD
ncbi:hypothetical protein LA080_015063 [Diaporthe eres]|nr:hypothetical protein LA080_015063 [Diaporthe eres]